MKKASRLLALVLALIMVACCMVGCNKDNGDETGGGSGKIDVVLMIENPDEPASQATIEKIKAKFPQYNIISKVWSAEAEQTVKSTFATDGEAIDLVMYAGSMANFVESDMALDLTPYLEANPELKNSFNEGILQNGQAYIDGKIYALPYSCVYPIIEVNTQILEQAGVEWKEAWTWDEFLDACEKIEENTDAFPIGCSSGWAGWFGVQAMITAIEDPAEYADFCAGKIPFSDPRIIANMDKVVDLYNSGYMYPGEGAVSITGEEVDTAFANGKLAMRCDVNSVSKGFIETLDIAEHVKIGSWPTMASGGVGSAGDRVLGGNNLYFIPANSKNVEAAIEILKYIFSEEIQTDYAKAGTIICTNVDTGLDLTEWSKDAGKVASDVIYLHSPEMSTYVNTDWMSEYLYDKESAISQMDELIADMAE